MDNFANPMDVVYCLNLCWPGYPLWLSLCCRDVLNWSLDFLLNVMALVLFSISITFMWIDYVCKELVLLTLFPGFCLVDMSVCLVNTHTQLDVIFEVYSSGIIIGKEFFTYIGLTNF